MRAILRVRNDFTFIEGTFPRVEVDKALSYYLPGFFMAPRYRDCQNPMCRKNKQRISNKTGRCPVCQKPRVWDGKKHLLLGGKFGTPYFPTGCLTVVARILTETGVQTIYMDERVKPLTTVPEAAYNLILNGRTPWPEQQQAIAAGLLYERGVIQTPTGGGKTTIMSGIAKLIPLPTVVLINNTSIAEQLRAEFEALLEEPIGLIKGGVFEPQRVTVAMTQSLMNALSLDKESLEGKLPPIPEALELVKATQLLMMDEAHHGSSDSWYTLAMKAFVNAYYKFGVTGTAFMRAAGDDLMLIGATGGLIYEVPEQQLIKSGRLALPIIHFYKINEPEIDPAATYQDVYQTGVVENVRLNKLASDIIKNLWQDAQILVLCERLEHIERLEYFLKGVKYEVLTGDSSTEDREEVKEQFIKGKVKIIIATKIFDEGVSISNIDVVIRMGLMKTSIKTKQQVGRGQRIKKDKPNVVHVIDFLHTSHRYLAEHSLEHFNMYERLQYPIILEQEPLTSLDCPEVTNGIQSSDMA
jgi:superfamily II DNA or RNA helicase